MPLPPADGPGTPRRMASCCAAGLALGTVASWARLAVEGSSRLETGTATFVVASLVLGVGLALAGICALRLTRLAGRLRPAELLAWAGLLHFSAALACALTSRDLYSNIAYGQLQLLGKNPYLVGPSALGQNSLLDLVGTRWLDTPTAYGPILSALSRLAALAGSAMASPIWGAAVAFKLAMLLCSLGTIALAHAHARRLPVPDGAEGVALLAFSPLLAWEISAQAHNDGVLVLALMAFVWAAGRGRELVAVLALVAGVMAKLAAAPLLALYLLLLLRRSPARALALGLVSTLAAALLAAPYWVGVATLQGPGATLGGEATRHAHSFADLLCLVLEPVAPRAAVAAYKLCWIGSTALCLGLFLRGARRVSHSCIAVSGGGAGGSGASLSPVEVSQREALRNRKSPLTRLEQRLRARNRVKGEPEVEDVAHHGLVLIFAYCLTTPWFHPWYATWLLPLAVGERDPALRRLVATYAVLTVVQWAVPLDPVTNVAVNGWAAMAWLRLARQRSAARATDPATTVASLRAEVALGDGAGEPPSWKCGQ